MRIRSRLEIDVTIKDWLYIIALLTLITGFMNGDMETALDFIRKILLYSTDHNATVPNNPAKAFYN